MNGKVKEIKNKLRALLEIETFCGLDIEDNDIVIYLDDNKYENLIPKEIDGVKIRIKYNKIIKYNVDRIRQVIQGSYDTIDPVPGHSPKIVFDPRINASRWRRKPEVN
jgi:hypothetical protein